MKNLKKSFCTMLICLSIVSCSNNDDSILLSTDILIKYVDQNDKNILDISNGINSSNIKIFHKINDEWIEYYESNLDYPKGYRVIEIAKAKYLKLFPSLNYYNQNFSETKIQFSEEDFDIVKTQFDLMDNGNVICIKVWYNEELKWEEKGTERKINIQK